MTKNKCTENPYLNHLERVALITEPAVKLGFEIVLCHDVLEDTLLTQEGLRHQALALVQAELSNILK